MASEARGARVNEEPKHMKGVGTMVEIRERTNKNRMFGMLNTREAQAARLAKGNGKIASAGQGPDNRSAIAGKGGQSYLRGSGDGLPLSSVPLPITYGNIDDPFSFDSEN